MSDLVERLKREASWSDSGSSACEEAAARITELEAENARLRDRRAQLSRGINMAMGCLNIFRSNDEKLAWYRLSDVATGREPRAALAGQGDGG